jgi:ribosomal protein S6--L-glutamate ligase
MAFSFKVVALEARLKSCRNVLTLGVKPNFSDYTPPEADLIRHSRKVYYPSSFYAELLDTAGIATFPSFHTYKYAQDKIKQTALFNILDLPHPRTRVFYGKRQMASITRQFEFPFIAKIPRGSAMGRGVFKIRNTEELENYTRITSIAYIQEFLPMDGDIRAVVIGNRVVHAYWRIAPENDFRSNVAVGGTVKLDKIPEPVLDLALQTARKCCWDDVGIDICCCNGRYYILEANMKYGKEGFRQAGIDYLNLMESMIENGEI